MANADGLIVGRAVRVEKRHVEEPEHQQHGDDHDGDPGNDRHSHRRHPDLVTLPPCRRWVQHPHATRSRT